VRVLLVGGTGPVGRTATGHLLADGHAVAVAHSGAPLAATRAQIEAR
jgi:uncharacterized protein YbjT (DUF2867 family)